MKVKIISLFILIVASGTGFTQTSEAVLESRVQKLEQERDLRQKEFDLAVQEMNQKSEKNIADKLENKDKELSSLEARIAVLTFLTAAFSLIAWISIWYSIKRHLNQQMQTRIDSLIQENEVRFREIIADKEVEARLRQDAKLLVISPSAALQERIMPIITQFKINAANVAYRKLTTKEAIDQLPLQDKSIVVINDIDSKFNRKLLQDLLVKTTDDVLFLGFATGNQQLPRHPKMSFANSKFTLYSNLLNMANYKSLAD